MTLAPHSAFLIAQGLETLALRLQRESDSALALARWLEVLGCFRRGEAMLGNQEIAERLYLSLSSVKSHLSHTYGRLGVRRREAAAAEARRQGLI